MRRRVHAVAWSRISRPQPPCHHSHRPPLAIEDPRDENLVIDVRVRAQTDEALRFWSDASGHLSGLIEHNLSPVSDELTLDFHWL
jgi:hypothetical protein